VIHIYWVRNDIGDLVSLKGLGDNLDRLGRGEHTFAFLSHGPPEKLDSPRPTNLYGIGSNVRQTCVDLFAHKCRRRDVNVIHAQGVLGCQGCCGGHAIAAMSCKDLLVRFETTGIVG
jgi:hypothetical protein